MMNRTWWSALAVLAVLATGCGGGGDGGGDLVGKPAPDFTLVDVDGRPVTLSALRGRAVLVDFWATWCPPCRALMPELAAMARRFDGRLEVVGVSVDGDPAAAVPPYAAEHGRDLTLTADAGAHEVARQWGSAGSIPSTYLVDPEGIVRHHWLGKHDRSDYERAVREVLGDAPAKAGGV